MGYAKLNFAGTVTNAQAMYDIVRVVNGTITSAANLSHASTTNSEIVNTLNQNWTVTYGTVAATTLAYVLENSCETAGKTKYAWLTTNTGGSYGGAAGAFSASSYLSNGIYLNTITGATSATAVSNPAHYSTNTATSGFRINNMNVDTVNTSIYVSWSKYHLALYGKFPQNGMGIVGTFEYPETALSQFTNTPPVLQYKYSEASTGTFIEAGGPISTTTNTIIFQPANLHYPQTNTTVGIGWTDAGSIGTADLDSFNAVQTLNSSGASVYPLVPIYESLPALGIPIINISQYSGVYKMGSGAGPYETLYTVGSDNYVWLPIAVSVTSTTIDCGITFLKK